MDSTENDDTSVRLRRLAGETERVAHVISDVLYLGTLVVVRQYHRVTLAGERANLVL